MELGMNIFVSQSSGFISSLFSVEKIELKTLKYLNKQSHELVEGFNKLDLTLLKNIEDTETAFNSLKYCLLLLNNAPSKFSYDNSENLSVELKNEIIIVKSNFSKIIEICTNHVSFLETKIQEHKLSKDQTLTELWSSPENDFWDDYYKSNIWRKK